MTRRGLVCAHRGASLVLPDNSVEAFVAAIASGCDEIETDVRLRDDGRLVLAHDTWDVVRPDVVELETLLDLARGRIGLDLEIVEVGLERALLEAVDGFPGWLIVTSTYAEVLEEVSRLSHHIDTGLVIEASYEGSPFVGDPFALADACGALVTLVEDEIATPTLVEQARGTGSPVLGVDGERRGPAERGARRTGRHRCHHRRPGRPSPAACARRRLRRTRSAPGPRPRRNSLRRGGPGTTGV